MTFNYITKPIQKLKADYSRRKQRGLNSFQDFADFEDWYNTQDKKCYYCGLKESESQEIVMHELLKSNRFPQKGKLERGKSRGMWLEVDRLSPKENYSRTNCVLCCYFCNNDKSDVFHGNEYKKFMKDRLGYLRHTLDRKNI